MNYLMRLMQQSELPVAAVAPTVGLSADTNEIEEIVEQRVLVTDTGVPPSAAVADQSAVPAPQIQTVEQSGVRRFQTASDIADATVTIEQQNITTTEHNATVDEGSINLDAVIESLEPPSQATDTHQSRLAELTPESPAINRDLSTEEADSPVSQRQASLNIVRQAIDWVAESVPQQPLGVEASTAAEMDSMDAASLVESGTATDTTPAGNQAAGAAEISEQFLEIVAPVVAPQQNPFTESAPQGRDISEETIDISIGAINVVVEAPLSATSVQSRQPHPVASADQPRQNGSRLHRRYLR